MCASAELYDLDDIDNLPSFEAEELSPPPPERSNKTASGAFLPLVTPVLGTQDNKDRDWDFDLSQSQISGEGICASAATTTNPSTENDFLKVSNRGRQSVKRAAFQLGTRLSIDPKICTIWAEETIAKGWCTFDDVDRLAGHCEGNGDLKELHENLIRDLEAAGIDIGQTYKPDIGLWAIRSDILPSDLAEAIEATLTRRTPLPGEKRFVMNKAAEQQLLVPIVHTKQKLQLGFLASDIVVETILNVITSIRDGHRSPGTVTLRNIIPSSPNHPETAEVIAAAETLKSWQANGRIMDGKSRRKALSALDALDFSMEFQKELALVLQRSPDGHEHAIQLNAQILTFETATERLILEYLPYVRRFAARNVAECEDPEDVFQVAFMGLQRATRRFDPERGYRFIFYATYWMRQAIMRWRSDEGAIIRIPVHRSEKVTKLDRALDRLDVRIGGAVTDFELANELEWAIDEVRQFRGIPREVEYPVSIDHWDNLLPEPSETDAFDQKETEIIVMDALSDLSERQAEVIRMRFGIGRDTEMTLEEIGQVYGVTRERIRQIEAKGLDRLSHPGRIRRLKELLGMG